MFFLIQLLKLMLKKFYNQNNKKNKKNKKNKNILKQDMINLKK